ncbi:MAG: transglutaminase family protein [Rhodospirillales bacterium]
MTRLQVKHSTVYHYRNPVSFGEHRLMFRPRDSHDMRLVNSELTISPPADIRWMHDVFSNSIAIATFKERSDTLSFESIITVDHFGLFYPAFPIEAYAHTVPFTYRPNELPDLGRTMEPHYPDYNNLTDAWARTFLNHDGYADTEELLLNMTQAINKEFVYETRTEPGVQTPVETLERRAGSCRDLALFMMEAVRCLGLAARFVSGYLHDQSLIDGETQLVGGGSTHAWLQVYIPGAGWVEFDPTNGLAGSSNLIRVAVARDPAQAIPLQGTYMGPPGEFVDMDINVTVKRLEPTSDKESAS